MILKKINLISNINKAGLVLTFIFIVWFLYNFAETSLKHSSDNFQQSIEKKSSDKEIKEASDKIIQAINYNQMFVRYIGLMTLSFSGLIFVLLIFNHLTIRKLKNSIEQTKE